MSGIKIYKCGLCNINRQFSGTRKGLREHLKKVHGIRKHLANDETEKQSWWIVEKFN
jgi:hypothetical protein